MSRKTNKAGYVKYDNEDELKEQLEQYYFPIFFDEGWMSIKDETKEVQIAEDSIIDYYGIKNNKETYIEVKNWFITNKDMKQILGYNDFIYIYEFYVICGGIDKERQKTLEENNIKIILTKDIEEIPDNEVIYWL